MGKFTPEEIQALYAPFPIKAHSIREGNRNKAGTRIRWYVYLDRVAVQSKLDELFVGDWEFKKTDIYRTANYITITASLTIRGITREFNGGDSGSGNDNDPENLEKGAMTDTFRRVASFWGLGAYLYNSVEIWTESYEKGDWTKRNALEIEAKRKFRDWYVAKYPEMNEASSEPSDSTPPPSTTGGSNGNGRSSNGNGSGKQLNIAEWRAASRFMFDTDQEHKEMVDFLLTSETVTPALSLDGAMAITLMNQASRKYGWDQDRIIETINSLGKGTFEKYGDYINANGTHREAWEAITTFNTLGTQSRSKNGNGKKPAFGEVVKANGNDSSKPATSKEETDPK